MNAEVTYVSISLHKLKFVLSNIHKSQTYIHRRQHLNHSNNYEHEIC